MRVSLSRRTIAVCAALAMVGGALACVATLALPAADVAASATARAGGDRLAERASAYDPYLVPPEVPRPASAAQRKLLRGSKATAAQGWTVVRLRGGPYRIGFQNGYLTAQSAFYWLENACGASGSAARRTATVIARRYVWKKIPSRYQSELKGITAGMRARGYDVTLWDVVAANDWADQACYAELLPTAGREGLAALLENAPAGGCSAFIATGTATSTGVPIAGHCTWSPYNEMFMNQVMFYVRPDKGYDFCYQAAGGQIWSGEDWYENSSGLLLTETSLEDSVYDPGGVPCFVRVRKAAQFSSTVESAVRTLLARNNGAYSAEWLIGDRTGTIASLQLGCRVYDLSLTDDGFYGSCNFPWGEAIRRQTGSAAPPYDPADCCYARYVRWGQLEEEHYGDVDLDVGKAMLADTYDTYLKKWGGDVRTLCGEPENGPEGVPYSGRSCGGACDGKVASSAMARRGQTVWARWGHPNGDAFDAARFLAANPDWAARHGALGVFGLETFSSQTPNPWTRLARP